MKLANLFNKKVVDEAKDDNDIGYIMGQGYYKCPYCNKTKKIRIGGLESNTLNIVFDSSLIVTNHICKSIDSRDFKYMKFNCIAFTPDDSNAELDNSSSKFIISDNDEIFHIKKKEGKEEV